MKEHCKIFGMKLIIILVVINCLGLSKEESTDHQLSTESVPHVTFSTESPIVAEEMNLLSIRKIHENSLTDVTSLASRSSMRSDEETAERAVKKSQKKLLQVSAMEPLNQQLELVNILQSEPKIVMESSAGTSSGLKATKEPRHGTARYLSGKQLGRDDPAINYESKYEADKFRFSYETKDGQLRAEHGIFENKGTADQNFIVKGSYSYFDEQHIEYIVNYTADNRGFRPFITVKNPNKQ